MNPKMAEITNRMIATKKMIFAISTANPAMPPNPSTAAIKATIKNVKAHPSMAIHPHLQGGRYRRRLINAPIVQNVPAAVPRRERRSGWGIDGMIIATP
jgi:hypothetical protein